MWSDMGNSRHRDCRRIVGHQSLYRAFQGTRQSIRGISSQVLHRQCFKMWSWTFQNLPGFPLCRYVSRYSRSIGRGEYCGRRQSRPSKPNISHLLDKQNRVSYDSLGKAKYPGLERLSNWVGVPMGRTAMHRRNFGENGTYHDFFGQRLQIWGLGPSTVHLTSDLYLNRRGRKLASECMFLGGNTAPSAKHGMVTPGVKCGIFPRWPFVNCCLALGATAKQFRPRSNYGCHRVSWLVR